jgi:hypothetical protein
MTFWASYAQSTSETETILGFMGITWNASLWNIRFPKHSSGRIAEAKKFVVAYIGYRGFN